MKDYIVTVSGILNIDDAFNFFINQVHMDYGRDVCEVVTARGFRRVLMVMPDVASHIKRKLNNMHLHSPTEFLWMGYDDEDMSTSSYIIYGLLPEIKNDRSSEV